MQPLFSFQKLILGICCLVTPSVVLLRLVLQLLYLVQVPLRQLDLVDLS
jgi:hypothetical protein